MMIPRVDLSDVLDDSNVHQRVVDEYFAASHLTVLAQRPVTGPSSVFSKGAEEKGRSIRMVSCGVTSRSHVREHEIVVRIRNSD